MTLSGGAAFGLCPDGPEDAARGIVVTLEPGVILRVTAEVGGLVESVQSADFTAERYEFTSLHGILPIAFTMRRSLEADAYFSGYAITWAGESMPIPIPGLDWSGDGERQFRNADGDDTESAAIRFEARVTAKSEVMIGNCRYDSLLVETLMDESDATFTTEEVIDYLPTLGIAILRQNRTVSRGEAPGEWYDWPRGISIARASD